MSQSKSFNFLKLQVWACGEEAKAKWEGSSLGGVWERRALFPAPCKLRFSSDDQTPEKFGGDAIAEDTCASFSGRPKELTRPLKRKTWVVCLGRCVSYIIMSCPYYRMRQEQNGCQTPKGTSRYRMGFVCERETVRRPQLWVGRRKIAAVTHVKQSLKSTLDGGHLRTWS